MTSGAIIVGLGNPGEKYNNTRHNIGRDVVVRFAEMMGISNWRRDARLQAHIALGHAHGKNVVLATPDTFMNKSGESVAQLMKEYPEAHLIVVHDDLDLPVGEMKVSTGKGAGGHNGVQNIIDRRNSKDFTRIRVGITPRTFFGVPRKPRGLDAVSRFVIAPFTRRERVKIEALVSEVFSALEDCLKRT